MLRGFQVSTPRLNVKPRIFHEHVLTEMRVKVDNADRTIYLRYASQERKCDSVVASKGEHARVELPVLGDTLCLGPKIGAGGAFRKDILVREFELAEGNLVVYKHHRYKIISR